jgi:phage tail protein X
MSDYTTVQGDTFDIVAYKKYGVEHLWPKIIEANPEYKDVVFFSGGVKLHIPDVEIKTVKEVLPPWKQ